VSIFALILFFATLHITWWLKKDLVEKLETRLIKEAGAIEVIFKDAGYDKKNISRLIQEISNTLDLRLTMVDDSGVVLADSNVSFDNILKMDNHGGREEIKKAIKSGHGFAIRNSGTLGVEMFYLAKKIEFSTDEWGILRLAIPLSEVDDTISKTLHIVYTASFFAFTLMLILSLVIATRLTSPIKNMINISKNIKAGNFGQKILDYPPNELGELGLAFDEMADELNVTIKKLTEKTNQLDAIFLGMSEGVMVVNNDLKILFTNNAFKIFFFMDLITEKGLSVEAIRNTALLEDIKNALKGKELYNRQLIVGDNRYFHVNLVPMRINGIVTGCIAVYHDITELKQLEQVRKDFVANVSHEFRTPLTAIIGYTETLHDEICKDNKQARQFLDITLKHARRLTALTDDLLHLSAIDSRQIRCIPSNISIILIFERLMQTFLKQAEINGQRLTTSVTPEQFNFETDSELLEQVLSILIDNAIKYTPKKGEIVLSADKKDEKIYLSVSDTGCGIPLKEQSRIFERFYRVNSERSRELGGTGLGLAIAKNLVKVLGGEISVESQLNKGSIFHIDLNENFLVNKD